MNRFKLFVQNFVIYGLGGAISRIVPLIMLPIVTRLMPDTTYFGLNDISTIVVSFGQALAIMGMYDAMFRMFFEKEDIEYKKDICSSALAFTLMTSLVLFVIMLLLRDVLAEFFFSDAQYVNLLVLSAISIFIGATNSIVSAPTRMNNQRGIYLVTNILSSVISYSLSIPLLLKGYYIIALPLSGVISAATIEIVFGILNRKWFSAKRINMQYIKEMLVIALPLMPNFLVYWVFNSCDRLMIAKILGNDYAGVYAIGGKMGQISQLIYTAFAGGWQYFAFTTMRDDDQVEMTSNIFEYLGVITFSAGMCMAALSEVIFDILFTEEYAQGAVVTPYLFVAPLLLMLFQVATNQFIVIKKTWPNVFILGIGAVLNVVINFILIPRMGIEGAALATFVGYVVSVVICVVVLINMKLFKISKKFVLCIVMFAIYGVLWRFFLCEYTMLSFAIACGTMMIYILLYKNDLKKVIKK